jgi:antitoxin ParD1/3/4
MHVSLTPALEAFAKAKVQSGRYNNSSEVVREALRLMMDRDQQTEMLREQVTGGFEQLKNGHRTDVHSLDEFVAVARASR